MPFKFTSNPDNQLEVVPELGRPFRVGSLQALSYSNAQVIRNVLKRRQASEAAQWLTYLNANDMMMLAVYSEWSVRWMEYSAKKFGKDGLKALITEALKVWVSTDTADAFSEARVTLKALLSGFACASDWQNAIGPITEGICKFPKELFDSLQQDIQQEQWDSAEALFETYFRCVRQRHDLFAQFCWAFPTAILKYHGQRSTEEALEGSFNALSMQELMWTVFASLQPELRAAFLAEHLRFHFSGSGREGSVQIIEESDRYRLVFDPCGSGGAMRRNAHTDGYAILPDASAMTWNRRNEVPAYCSHCAVNELQSIRRVGFPLWVTEFDPDAMKPCGWTVYKDPSKIPAHYFSRLGLPSPSQDKPR